MRNTVAALLTLTSLLLSCSKDDDGYQYPEMTAEICDVHTSVAKTIVYAVADDDRHIDFMAPLTASWATRNDTVYRALLYYNKVNDEAAVQPLMAERVPVLTPVPASNAKEWMEAKDPLALVAAWYARNGKYLNLRLALKTGSTADDTQKQSIGLVCDTVITHTTCKRYCYRLCHDQNDVPTYYTVDVHASIQTDNVLRGDTVSLTVPTWSGLLEKHYIMQ